MADQVERSMMGALPPDADPWLHQIHAYWESIRPSPGLLPGRQHFDPVDIPKLLPWLWLTDVLRDPLRFQYRLTGTEHVKFMGSDRKGRFLHELHENFTEMPTYRQHIAVVETGKSAYRAGHPSLHERRYRWIERVLLPLARDGARVDMIIGMAHYSDVKWIDGPRL